MTLTRPFSNSKDWKIGLSVVETFMEETELDPSLPDRLKNGGWKLQMRLKPIKPCFQTHRFSLNDYQGFLSGGFFWAFLFGGFGSSDMGSLI